MDSLTVYMGTLTVVEVKTVDIEYPLQDIALQIAKSSKKLIYMNTLGPKQRDSSSLGTQTIDSLICNLLTKHLPIIHNFNAICVFILQ